MKAIFLCDIPSEVKRVYPLFASMPGYAAFINTGRGAQVIEEDLARILQEREDITALLDMTNLELPVAGPLFYQIPNCILSPHITGSIRDEVHRMAVYMAEELEWFLENIIRRYEILEDMLKTMA